MNDKQQTIQQTNTDGVPFPACTSLSYPLTMSSAGDANSQGSFVNHTHVTTTRK